MKRCSFVIAFFAACFFTSISIQAQPLASVNSSKMSVDELGHTPSKTSKKVSLDFSKGQKIAHFKNL
ncbi:MAG: hypothetical protein AAFO07_33755, partial [Bacteroidota bacterium]